MKNYWNDIETQFGRIQFIDFDPDSYFEKNYDQIDYFSRIFFHYKWMI